MCSISVLMAVHNSNMCYFEQSVNALSNQSIKDFELVLVNDGDDVKPYLNILNKYSINYRIINNEMNLGLTQSLNKGIKECQGKYIARIDDDDIMEYGRLQIQFDFLETHKDVAAVFSNAKIIDMDGNVISESKIINQNVRKFLISRGNCLYHSSLFIRSDVLKKVGGYDARITYAQDYDLYLRIINDFNIYVLPDVLIRYRQIDGRISIEKRILSRLCAYYGSLKYLHTNPNFFYFLSITGRTIYRIFEICFLKKYG